MTETIIELTRNRAILRAELNRTESGSGSSFMEVGHSHAFSDLRSQLIDSVQCYLRDELPWESCNAIFQGLVYESVWENIHKTRGRTEEESRESLAEDLAIHEKAPYAVVRKIERLKASDMSAVPG